MNSLLDHFHVYSILFMGRDQFLHLGGRIRVGDDAPYRVKNTRHVGAGCVDLHVFHVQIVERMKKQHAIRIFRRRPFSQGV